jgi:hypothetical protein
MHMHAKKKKLLRLADAEFLAGQPLIFLSSILRRVVGKNVRQKSSARRSDLLWYSTVFSAAERESPDQLFDRHIDNVSQVLPDSGAC